MKFKLALLAFVAAASVTATAHAGLVVYTAPESGFLYNSDTVSPSFNAALGANYTHLSFANATNNDGSSYSPAVDFSTQASSYGGSNTPLVNAEYEIGPYGDWYGILNVDFASPVSVVGFGIVDPVTISVFSPSGALLGTYNSPAGSFNLWGVAATGGEEIGDVQLNGAFFAIQDTAFSGGVPEPTTWALMLLGMGGLGLTLRSRRRQPFHPAVA